MATQRTRRVAEQVREVLAELALELKDPRLGFLTITEVRVTADLKRAEVYYTVLPDDPEVVDGTAAGLASATPLLRRALGTRLRTRYVPDLHFTPDPLPERGRRIDRLLSDSGSARPDGEPPSGRGA